jgi:tRNA(Ile)-lysidine synthase
VKTESPLPTKVRRCLAGLGPVPDGIVVAVSGGPDSVALLRALLDVRPPDMPLVIFHLNHRLRGDESDGDAAFVVQLHAELGKIHDNLQLRCQAVDVALIAQAAGDNLEAAARNTRYDWLNSAAIAASCRFVATGHTADDQAETVLHRLLRGTGLTGLRGIAARRPLTEGVEVIRPLLHVSRAEVLAYLDELKQPYRLDSSNQNLDLTRNRIRHELLPLLAREYNPAIARLLTQLAEQADEAARIVASAAQELLTAAELPRAGPLLIFDRQRLTQAPRHVVREAFRLAWLREDWPQAAMNFAAWERLAELICTAQSALDLPGGLQARCRGRVVQVGPMC